MAISTNIAMNEKKKPSTAQMMPIRPREDAATHKAMAQTQHHSRTNSTTSSPAFVGQIIIPSEASPI